MAKNGTVTITIVAVGDGSRLDFTIGAPVNSISPANHQTLALASGANTITPPLNAMFCVLVPPPGSSVVKTLKGITGDTGFVLNSGAPTMLSMPLSAGPFVINCGGIETVEIYWV